MGIKKRNKFKIVLLLIFLFFIIPFQCWGKNKKQNTNNNNQVKSTYDNDIKRVVEQQFVKQSNILLPLDKKQIAAFKEKFNATQQAIKDNPTPILSSKTERLSLTPGSKIPLIKMAPGYVASVIISDSSGEPWPITSVTNGNKNSFFVTRPKVAPGNLLTLSAKIANVHTNLVITLKNLSVPMILQVQSISNNDNNKQIKSAGIVAYQINKRGPNAKTPFLGDSVKTSVTATMLNFVDGIPPAQAIKINCLPKKLGLSVWKFNNKIYCRSAKRLIWPAWDQMDVSSGGEYHVYRLPIVPVLVIIENGQTQTIKLKI